ncbi:MmgE/PrpD family protein [Candidimonas nitroreducens]|uniref:MmgE/PrpD family protein n=1 Tax=Candidimonas nitroreducens TaxID=683354 RepID=A0A225MF09_9BURK|nr:MmgE/PrpD family protein [Candidimonas nitroreducens]OWT57559.1 hypothetical protein CEY11_16830 [Candidimonas nitroreducens]
MTTRALSKYVTTLNLEMIPVATREAAKRLFLDGVGCLIAGIQGTPARMVANMVVALEGNRGTQSTIVISNERASARDAAFVNGVTLYSVGVNDIHKASCSHPGGCTIPTVLAVGEWLQSSGADMISAMIASYDVIGRLGRATMPSHRARGFHATGTYGTFGATAATGRLLGLDVETMASAFGIAGSQAAGLLSFQTDGALTMIFHAGRSAQNGVEACLLAREGLDGPKTVFEDPHGGFLSATSDDSDPSALTGRLGEFYEIDDTSFRPFYGCTYTVAASSATKAIVDRVPRYRVDGITGVAIRCHHVVMEEVNDPDPQTLLAARLSMQFNVGLVLVRGDVVVGDVTEKDLWNPLIRRLLPAITFQRDDSLSHWASGVTIRFNDGRIETCEVSHPKGDPANPMDWDATTHKFHRLLEPAVPQVQRDDIVRIVRNIEKENGASVMAAIRAAAHPDKEKSV